MPDPKDRPSDAPTRPNTPRSLSPVGIGVVRPTPPGGIAAPVRSQTPGGSITIAPAQKLNPPPKPRGTYAVHGPAFPELTEEQRRNHPPLGMEIPAVAEEDPDSTYAGQQKPELLAVSLRPPDLDRRPAAEQFLWKVAAKIESDAQSSHERMRRVDAAVKLQGESLSEHRAQFAQHCAANEIDRLDTKTQLTEINGKVALSGKWGRIVAGSSAVAGLLGGIAALLVALSQSAKSCEPEHPHVARDQVPEASKVVTK